jgi:hypothetical protein
MGSCSGKHMGSCRWDPADGARATASGTDTIAPERHGSRSQLSQEQARVEAAGVEAAGVRLAAVSKLELLVGAAATTGAYAVCARRTERPDVHVAEEERGGERGRQKKERAVPMWW